VRWRDELALAWRVRIMQTSNCYAFPSEAGKRFSGQTVAAEPSKSSFQSGTGNQFLNPDLLEALDRLKGVFERAGSPETSV
jgi:hypothetical protein